jgi:hypothetical protein
MKSKRFWLLAMLFIIILAGLVGIFIFTPQGRSLNPFIKTKSITSQQDQKNIIDSSKQSETSEAKKEPEKPKYDIADAKSTTSALNDFTFYYPKTWFSEDEIDHKGQRDYYGYTSFFYFYPDSTYTGQGPERTYFTIMVDRDSEDLVTDGSLENYTKTRIVEGRDGDKLEPVRFQNTDAFKIVDDHRGYFEGYTFVKPQLKYYRQENNVFLLGIHTPDKATFEKMRPEIEFMFDSFELDSKAYNTPYKAPVLSSADQQRKYDIEAISDILDKYYNYRGEYPLYLNYEGVVTKLQQEEFLDHDIQDPAWPNKSYRYGVVCDETRSYKAGTCYFRVDAEFDDATQAMLKNDGGVDDSRYEVGSSIGLDKNRVQYMR